MPDALRASLNSVSDRTINFIPSEEFQSTVETQFQESEFEMYSVEDGAPAGPGPHKETDSLQAALQQCRLLTFEGEQFLFKQLNFLRFRASAIQATMNRARPAKKAVSEVERLLRDAEAAREEIAKANLRLVASIAGRLSISREEFDEFVAEGNAILLYAIDKFDYSRGFRFSTYVTHAVQRHLYRVIERRRKQAQREYAREAEMLAEEPAVEFDPCEPTEADIKAAASTVIAKIDETLDEREQVIVRGRFGLDGSGKGQTFRMLGEELGLSKERVRQLFQRGIEKLGPVAKPFESLFASR